MDQLHILTCLDLQFLCFFSPSRVRLRGSYFEASDNVYEDVETINRFILSQNSHKRKGGLKSKKVNTVSCIIFKMSCKELNFLCLTFCHIFFQIHMLTATLW